MLDVGLCIALKRLPETLGQLTQLQMLDISGCNALEQLPFSFAHLPRSVHISMKGLQSVRLPYDNNVKDIHSTILPYRDGVFEYLRNHNTPLKVMLLTMACRRRCIRHPPPELWAYIYVGFCFPYEI
jgi:hypothetical protein